MYRCLTGGVSPADNDDPYEVTSEDAQVDFRYVGSTCLILFLDGHSEPAARFSNLPELGKRQIRVKDLDKR